ncbi:MAG: peptidoglycan-binding protein [Acidimicrobiales bacterium]
MGTTVAELRVRLAAMGYWSGAPSDRIGPLLQQAVYALQKAQELTIDGVVGPEVRGALNESSAIVPVLQQPDHVEIDLTRQLIIFVAGGSPFLVFNTSTGTNERYQHPTQGLQLADTPTGTFLVDWQVDGVSDGDLGPLYRPKFFHPDGIAVHGYADVPPVPASHGCARVSVAAMDLIWQLDLMPIGSVVHVVGAPPI